MDRLSEYVIKHSSCCMPRCEYVENDIEIDCDICQARMIQEHDRQIRADAIDEFANKLIDELHYNVSAKPVTINTPYATPIMIDGEIQKIAEQLKEQEK